MHACDHGVSMHIITAIVRMLHKLEAALDLPENTLVKKLTARIHNLCSSLETKHTTMIRFSHQSVVHLFENLTTKNKKGKKQSPIVDATDMQKLMLNLPYLLDGLADEELRVFNTNHPAGRAEPVHDPIPAAIMAVNDWLQWYQLYRKETPDESDTERLEELGRALLTTLVKVFPFKVAVGLQWRSMWCNEKIHSLLHGPSNLMKMGRAKNFSCQVTETKHKSIKIKALRSNRNPASMGYSILYQEVRDAALANIAQVLDAEAGLDPDKVWKVNKRRRLASEADPESASDVMSDSDSDLDRHSDTPVLPAMRYFERDEQDKTRGCMGDGLRCSVWARAQCVEHMDFRLTKGWTRVQGVRRGNLGLLMQELNWTPASGGSQPDVLVKHPFLAWIPNKVVHYLVDYHSEWLEPLDIPASNGEHNQLKTHHFQDVLKCLEIMPEVSKHVQCYSTVILQHSRAGFLGDQTVHASLINTKQQRSVYFNEFPCLSTYFKP